MSAIGFNLIIFVSPTHSLKSIELATSRIEALKLAVFHNITMRTKPLELSHLGGEVKHRLSIITVYLRDYLHIDSLLSISPSRIPHFTRLIDCQFTK